MDIKGYRELTEFEIGRINEIKQAGVVLGALVDDLKTSLGVDQRWVSIGATNLQQGLMALTRAVAKPTTF